MNSSETLEVTMHMEMERDFFENKIVTAQELATAQSAESLNMEDLPGGSVKVNVRNMIPKPIE